MGSAVAAIADPNRTVAPRSAADGLSVILLVGAPVSYVAALVAAVPAIAMLRRWGAGAVPGVLAVGAVVGAVTAIVLGPYLRGELFSVILTPWQGAALGGASAGVYCWLHLRTAAAG
jgi:hypothetical protein